MGYFVCSEYVNQLCLIITFKLHAIFFRSFLIARSCKTVQVLLHMPYWSNCFQNNKQLHCKCCFFFITTHAVYLQINMNYA